MAICQRDTSHQSLASCETNIVFKSGDVEIPFVPDVVLVKDISVFPTWMNFPYQPEYLKLLTLSIRIIQPGTAIVPDEWVNAARYDEAEYRGTDQWNILMDIRLYAFGCFSVKPDSV